MFMLVTSSWPHRSFSRPNYRLAPEHGPSRLVEAIPHLLEIHMALGVGSQCLARQNEWRGLIRHIDWPSTDSCLTSFQVSHILVYLIHTLSRFQALPGDSRSFWASTTLALSLQASTYKDKHLWLGRIFCCFKSLH